MERLSGLFLLLLFGQVFSAPADLKVGNGDERIVGGEDTEEGEFPYLVALTIDFGIFCGGTLIDLDRVLTAAHCMEGAGRVDVLAGAYDRTDASEPSQQTRTSTNYVVHPEWSRFYGVYDLAIVFLDEPFDASDRVQPATRAEVAPEEFDLVTAAGWGLTSDDLLAQLPDTPMKVTRPVIPIEVAQGYDDFPDRFLFTTVICIDTTGGHGTCSGDSGGPLLDGEGNQAGITSYGGSQCTTGVPGCFTDVAMFNDWIDDQQP